MYDDHILVNKNITYEDSHTFVYESSYVMFLVTNSNNLLFIHEINFLRAVYVLH